MNRRIAMLLAVALPLLNACVTAKASGVPTPRERVDEWVQLCDGVGLKMTARVVIMSSAGCVCSMKPEHGAAPTAEASGVSGGAIIAAAAEAARQQQAAVRR